MKKIAFLILIVLIATSAWYSFKEPQFEGLYPQTQRDIWMFRKEKFTEPKYVLAKRIYSQVQFMEFGNDKPEWLSDESKTINAAQDYTTEIENLAQDFESKLSPEEISQITQANPYSLFRTVNKLWSQMESLECTQEEFNNLLTQFDRSEFASRGKYIAVIAYALDQKYIKEYINEVISLLETDPKYENYKILAKEFYPTKLNPSQITPEAFKDFQSSSDIATRVTPWIMNAKKDLINSGLPEDSIESYVLDKAKLSPACLGTIASQSKPWFRQALKPASE